MKIFNKCIIFRSPILIRDYEENPLKEFKYVFYMRQVKKALREGKKLLAVKIYKVNTGKGLKESKDYIDSICYKYYHPLQ